MGILSLIIIAALVLWIASMYNRLVGLRQRVKNAWSQIDVQLKRRYDLIPNLVETVKGYAAHEKETFEMVTKARAQMASARTVGEQAEAQNAITGALRSLFAVAEAYPELKANQNFMMLQEELSGTENKIAYARQFYNDTVMKYNTMLEVFPSNMIANAFQFRPQEFFEIEEGSREPVKVSFK